MRRAFVFLSFSYALAVGAIWAANAPVVDFDQVIEISDVLESARESSRQDKIQREYYGSGKQPLLARIKLPAHIESIGPQGAWRDASKGELKELRPCEQINPDLDEGAAILAHRMEDGALPPCTIQERLEILWGDQKVKPLPMNGSERVAEDAYESISRDSKPYAESEHWLAQVPRMPIGNQQRFRDWHQSIKSTRANLMQSGKSLDRNEAALVERVRGLRRWSSRIDARSDLIQRDVDDFNRICRDNPNPPRARCRDWAESGKACIGRHNSSVGRFNAANNQWKGDRDKHFIAVDSYKTGVKSWEDDEVVPFNLSVQRNLAVKKVEIKNCKAEFFGSSPELPGKCVQTCVVTITDLRTGQSTTTTEQFSQVVNRAAECQPKPNTTACVDENDNVVSCP